MGIFDKAKETAENLKDKAEDLVGEHGDKIVDGGRRRMRVDGDETT